MDQEQDRTARLAGPRRAEALAVERKLDLCARSLFAGPIFPRPDLAAWRPSIFGRSGPSTRDHASYAGSYTGTEAEHRAPRPARSRHIVRDSRNFPRHR